MESSDQQTREAASKKVSPEFSPEKTPPAPIPLRAWIIGLSAPLMLVCFCGGFLLLLFGANSYLNKGQINAWSPSNDSNSTGSQKVTFQGGSVEILDSNSALEKIHNMDDRILNLQEHAVEKYTDAEMNTIGKFLNYTVPLNNSTPGMFGVGWCARNQEILKNNLADIETMLVVDGTDVDMQHTAPWVFYYPNGTICQRFDVVVDNWSVGDHTLSAKMHIKNTINDGTGDFGPGEWGAVYKVTVKSSVEATRAPKK